ncbi:MAG TPA: Holliday junction branch migration protein RuvA [Alphaproteobacteria bacterium]|nr:Holliday junction branch migration protein RuvA [Alphaproteobacteria bacterium]
MIALLTGAIDSLGDNHAVIDVGGVGYLVFASRRTLDRLPGRGNAVRLLIETHVREDHIHLYGFLDAAERAWFRLLTTVQGVGAKVALAVLSVLSPEELARAIAAQDRTMIARADGVGPKLAQRIAIELKDKAGEIALGPGAVNGSGASPALAVATEGGAAADAVSALVNLGYRRAEAFGAVAQAAHRLGADAPLESLIKAGLKELSA